VRGSFRRDAVLSEGPRTLAPSNLLRAGHGGIGSSTNCGRWMTRIIEWGAAVFDWTRFPRINGAVTLSPAIGSSWVFAVSGVEDRWRCQ
jgi:hypothetical protein